MHDRVMARRQPPGPVSNGGDGRSRLNSLRSRVESLGYEWFPLPAANGRLAGMVERLVGDLANALEEKRESKREAEVARRQSQAEAHKVEVLLKENGRLVRENNQLHMQIIQEAEVGSTSQRESSLHMRRLEGEIESLRYWKTQSMDRMRVLESDNEALRNRLQQLLNPPLNSTSIKFPRSQTQGSMAVSVALDGQPKGSWQPAGYSSDALERKIAEYRKMADLSISAIKRELNTAQEEQAELQRQLRDAEVCREVHTTACYLIRL
ncbi:hypothetical protein CBR_g22913 [Chara braunii]|uniref:Centrosomal protein of 70 kDa n=1 Tax=Chara braunii TaxID=69332 RepID=A0A388L303_CHABU|nr:hypothetical protein CBR_g22913 [Chara braunii]|eukprot:GBG76695.1 hypothetical protein CBR_g22913 [Chara braunii]